jgi:hypothetical protein
MRTRPATPATVCAHGSNPSKTKAFWGIRPQFNTTPFTNAQRKRFQPKKVMTIKPFAPTIKKVKEIVTNKLIPKLKRYH